MSQVIYDLEKRLPLYQNLLIKLLERKGNEKLLRIVNQSRFELTARYYDDYTSMSVNEVTLYIGVDLYVDIFDSRSEYEKEIQNLFNKIHDWENECIEVKIFASDEVIINTQKSFSFHIHNKMPSVNEADIVRIWKNENNLKVFISHRDANKREASCIQKELEQYNISSFVAHEDIEPTEEWIKEILRALQTMDVLLVYITEDFFDSKWTNQEVGFALGKNIPVIPIKEEINPEGFISILQAKKYNSSTFCYDFISVLLTASIGIDIKNKLIDCLIVNFANSKNFKQSAEMFKYFDSISTLSDEQAQRMIEAFNTNSEIKDCHYLNGHNFYEKKDNGLLCKKLKEWTGRDYETYNSHSSQGLIIREKGQVDFMSLDNVPF